MTDNFEIIYKELKKIDPSQNGEKSLVNGKETSPSELDEIAELRRIVLELNDPESSTYTSS
ncbi:MAG: hypothetical protein ABID67_00085 [Candidatus Nealsonbacteria bacterium]